MPNLIVSKATIDLRQFDVDLCSLLLNAKEGSSNSYCLHVNWSDDGRDNWTYDLPVCDGNALLTEPILLSALDGQED